MHILISCGVGAKVSMFLKKTKPTPSFDRKKEENWYCEKVTVAQCWINAAAPSGCQQTREVQQVTVDPAQMPACSTLLVLLKNRLFLHSKERKEPLFCRETNREFCISYGSFSQTWRGKGQPLLLGSNSLRAVATPGIHLPAPLLPVVSQLRGPAEEILKSWK